VAKANKTEEMDLKGVDTVEADEAMAKLAAMEAELAAAKETMADMSEELANTQVELDEAQGQIDDAAKVASVTRTGNGEFPLVLRKIGTDLVFPWTAARARKSGFASISEEDARACIARKEAADRARVTGATLNVPQSNSNPFDSNARPTIAQLLEQMNEDELRKKAAELKVHVGDSWKIGTIRKHVGKAMVEMDK
jgi:chromosome segregation ATPase